MAACCTARESREWRLVENSSDAERERVSPARVSRGAHRETSFWSWLHFECRRGKRGRENARETGRHETCGSRSGSRSGSGSGSAGVVPSLAHSEDSCRCGEGRSCSCSRSSRSTTASAEGTAVFARAIEGLDVDASNARNGESGCEPEHLRRFQRVRLEACHAIVQRSRTEERKRRVEP